jgi:hypothetical protein
VFVYSVVKFPPPTPLSAIFETVTVVLGITKTAKSVVFVKDEEKMNSHETEVVAETEKYMLYGEETVGVG